jgi:hypothetical protein
VYRFPGRGALVIIANALLGLPPVFVGLVVYLLLSRSGPFGSFGILFIPTAMTIAQCSLGTPIVTALIHRTSVGLWAAYGDSLLVDGASRLLALESRLPTSNDYAGLSGRSSQFADAQRPSASLRYLSDTRTNRRGNVADSRPSLACVGDDHLVHVTESYYAGGEQESPIISVGNRILLPFRAQRSAPAGDGISTNACIFASRRDFR